MERSILKEVNILLIGKDRGMHFTYGKSGISPLTTVGIALLLLLKWRLLLLLLVVLWLHLRRRFVLLNASRPVLTVVPVRSAAVASNIMTLL